MEQALVHLLAETQSSAEAPRKQAEEQLQQLYYDENFPLTLCSIASSESHPLPIRQSSLLTLKNFILAGWSPAIDEFNGQVLVSEQSKSALRDALFALATSETAERRIQNAASYVVSKIASADYPDQWSGLVPTLIALIPTAADARLHGALKILAELVDEGLSEEQYFQIAQDLVNVLYTVAADESRKPWLRALATSVFKGCFDILDMVMQDHKAAVKAFAEPTVNTWMPLCLGIMKMELPTRPSEEDPAGEDGPQTMYRGFVALKLQVVKTLMKIRETFPSFLSPHTPQLFTATWEELSTLQSTYQAHYIDDEQEGRLEDSDGLPYTMDFLVLEDLDFMAACIRAPPVRKELESQLQTQAAFQPGNWVYDVMKLVVSYAQITTEEEGIWQIDLNVFLAEETSVTANYTPRTACGDLIIKLGEWLSKQTMEGLLSYSKTLLAVSNAPKPLEAALYIFYQVLSDWTEMDRKIDLDTAHGFLEIIQFTMQQQDIFLRARGYITQGVLVKAVGKSMEQTVGPLLEATLRAIVEDSSDVVQVSCIRALQFYFQSVPPSITLPLQPTIIDSLSTWVSSQDLSELADSDDLLIALLETLRDTILLDTRICVTGDGLNLLFTIASKGASNFQVVALVTESFEEICNTVSKLGDDSYIQLCQRVLPSLTGAFDVGAMTEENALTNLAAELLVDLAKFGPSPLPAGFVAAVMPKVNGLLLGSNDDELLKNCTEAVKNMLHQDVEQVLAWQDPNDAANEGGLRAVLVIIDRLLGPTVDDSAAAEVGGLAAELVEKAGADRLGPFLMQLLRAVAERLATAQQAQLIQSLILVFARLSLHNAGEVVDFLYQVQVGSESGLQIVLSRWMENSINFAGYDEIRQNVIALCRLYELHDERLAQVHVKGDLIPNPEQAGRIMTRSKARQNPDQFTVVPVPIKILKVLIEEMSSASQPNLNGAAALAAAGADGEDELASDDDDDDWEDDPAVLDLGLGSTKEELMAFAEEAPQQRQMDDETQAYLVQFFRTNAQDQRFQENFGHLTAGEQDKLRAVG